MKVQPEFVGVLSAIGTAILSVLGLVLAFPEASFSLAIESTRAHIGAGLIVVAILLAACRAWRRGVFLLLTGAMVVTPFFQMTLMAILSSGDESGQSTIRILTFNILGSNTENGERIVAYVLASGADIVFIQEAVPLSPYLAQLDATYPYRVGCGKEITVCDSLLLSNLPLTDIRILSIGPVFEDRTIVASITSSAGPLWIVGTHLTKPYFDIIGLSELKRLLREIGRLDEAVVVAGDFNAGLHAGVMANLRTGAGLAPGPSEPATWPAWAGALGIPIDHVLARLPARILRTDAISDAMGSNHRGLESVIAVVPTLLHMSAMSPADGPVQR